MGSGTFFSKIASVDPLAHALHLPGANAYANQEAEDANSTGAVGPYAGVAPTLAGANAGYAPGGPGANSSYTPFVAKQPGGLFGTLQRGAQLSGNVTPTVTSAGTAPTNPSMSTAVTPGQNPYAQAAQAAPNRQAAMMQPASTTNKLFSTGGNSYGV